MDKDSRQPIDEESRSRISRLERGHAALETGQQSLGREIGQMREALDSFAGEMRQGIERLQQGRAYDNRANWPVLLSAATVMLALGALVSGGFRADLSRVEGKVDVGQARAFATAGDRFRLGDHVQYAANVKEEFARLDAALQREMRDLDAATKAELKSLTASVEKQFALWDARLQIEMELRDGTQKIQLKQLGIEQMRLRDWQAAHDRQATLGGRAPPASAN